MSQRLLGVLGGMGPLASAQFMVRLTLLTQAACDQDHVAALLWSDPTIADRAPALLRHPGAANPLPAIRAAIQGLRRAGCGAVVMPCNTVHGWHEEIAAEGLPILHIVDAVEAQLRSSVRAGAAIGIIGTACTHTMRLYETRLEPAGWRCLAPSHAEIDGSIMPAIAAVKGNRVEDSHAPIAAAIGGLVSRGAEAIVLGCTELGISVAAGPDGEQGFAGFGVPLIDSTDALAHAAIAWSRGRPVMQIACNAQAAA